MVRIVQKMWYYGSTGFDGNDHSFNTIRCSVCGGFLKIWYVNIIKSLKNFLPEDFEPICCACAVLQALAKKGLIPLNRRCLKCNDKIVFASRIHGWEFVCGSCGKCFCRLTDEETFKLTKEYLRSCY